MEKLPMTGKNLLGQYKRGIVGFLQGLLWTRQQSEGSYLWERGRQKGAFFSSNRD